MNLDREPIHIVWLKRDLRLKDHPLFEMRCCRKPGSATLYF